MTSILIEGWRFTPNSFASVNQFQCLELMKREGIEIFHKDVPYWNPDWKPVYNLLAPDVAHKLLSMPEPGRGQVFDATLRMGVPFDFTPSESPHTTVFATCEFGVVSKQAITGDISLGGIGHDSSTRIITPSAWSGRGLVNSGADPEKIAIIPHGVDPDIFYPLSSQERSTLRKKLGWEGHFVFLNVSAMTPNKGIPLVLEAMGSVAQRHPPVSLVLKGLDSWYSSNRHIETLTKGFSSEAVAALAKRVTYTGGTLSYAGIASYYQAADAYIAPYTGEGFNIPVLEAMACGLPVICTGGGATDDFTNSETTLAIRSKLKKSSSPGEYSLVPDRKHMLELMYKAIEDDDWMAQARLAGPAHVRSGWTWEHVVDRLLPVVLGEA